MRRGEKMRHGKRMALAPFTKLWMDRSISAAKIAAMLDVTPQAVHNRAANRNLPKRGNSKAGRGCMTVGESREAEFIEMWNAGVYSRDIAAWLDCSHVTVPKTAARLGLAPRGRKWRAKMSLAQFREEQAARLLAVQAAAEVAASRAFWARTGAA